MVLRTLEVRVLLVSIENLLVAPLLNIGSRQTSGQSTQALPSVFDHSVKMLRILTRTAMTSSRMPPAASSARCTYAPSRSFLWTTATVAAETSKPSAVDESAIIPSKNMPQLDPKLVDPVLRWLLDEQNTLEAPIFR